MITWFNKLQLGEIVSLPASKICKHGGDYFIPDLDPFLSEFRERDRKQDPILFLMKTKTHFICVSHTEDQFYERNIFKKKEHHLFDIGIKFRRPSFYFWKEYNHMFHGHWEYYCEMYQDHLSFLLDFPSDLLDVIINYLAARETNLENVFFGQGRQGWYSFSKKSESVTCQVEWMNQKVYVLAPSPPAWRKHLHEDHIKYDDWHPCTILVKDDEEFSGEEDEDFEVLSQEDTYSQ